MSTDVVTLGNLLARGVYCGLYEVVGEPDVIAKAALTVRIKQYFPGFRINYPLRAYARYKYGVRDLVRHDYESLQQLPPIWRDHLPPGLRLAQTADGAGVMCWPLIRDYDGARSRNLLHTGPVDNEPFWTQMHALVEACRRQRVWPMGLFPGSQQVTVQRVSPDEWRPIITADLIKLGHRMYPFQFYLRLPPILRWKFERRYRAFVKRYQRPPGGITAAPSAAAPAP